MCRNAMCKKRDIKLYLKKKVCIQIKNTVFIIVGQNYRKYNFCTNYSNNLDILCLHSLGLLPDKADF